MPLAAYTLLRLWFIADVELGKDQAVDWYWGQHLDVSYTLLPLAILKEAHAVSLADPLRLTVGTSTLGGSLVPKV